jgi:hypothetical protein
MFSGRKNILLLSSQKTLFCCSPKGGTTKMIPNKKTGLVVWKIIPTFGLSNLKYVIMKAGDRVILEQMDDDPNPVPIGTEGTIVHIGGGKNIRLEKQFGWDNQSEVVVFTWNTPDDFEQIKNNLIEVVGTEWLLTHKKTGNENYRCKHRVPVN